MEILMARGSEGDAALCLSAFSRSIWIEQGTTNMFLYSSGTSTSSSKPDWNLTFIRSAYIPTKASSSLRLMVIRFSFLSIYLYIPASFRMNVWAWSFCPSRTRQSRALRELNRKCGSTCCLSLRYSNWALCLLCVSAFRACLDVQR